MVEWKETVMKHLLIIILSILLLSSPLIGQETGVLYQYETSSGFVWETFGDDKIQPKYKGKVKNVKPNGQGIITYPDGRHYVGEWSGGTWNGQGKYTFKDGFGYEGEWKNGKRCNGTEYNKYGKIIGKYLKGKYKTNKPQKPKPFFPPSNPH